MGMITAACFSINPIGKTGAIVLMLSHGLTRKYIRICNYHHSKNPTNCV